MCCPSLLIRKCGPHCATLWCGEKPFVLHFGFCPGWLEFFCSSTFCIEATKLWYINFSGFFLAKQEGWCMCTWKLFIVFRQELVPSRQPRGLHKTWSCWRDGTCLLRCLRLRVEFTLLGYLCTGVKCVPPCYLLTLNVISVVIRCSLLTYNSCGWWPPCGVMFL